ncbi:HD domain-containing protein [Pseudodesulfovibrio piezophilus]|uniref:Metal-dependent phosphohydrolase HD sub domain protein n=1 Tax=Pseudodesulfovibrio piezophilus (strain DSM 21447 / JCM 15486 / C1TLV30) TaxID=1322246 RepID=M1WUI6_PSEP2|nr:HD domain-containing protein [Pseudodesulfovibrio piezophilus]CCH47403.1 Metal-dependent phosphohydrolase HD sub domain protein [Pseudodesulfovibrio piezophilus C1TLV30]
MTLSIDEHVDTLIGFANGHFHNEKAYDAQIQLKITHSLAVLENAKAIIRSEKISPHEADLCHLAALYHDIGRFPQFSRYQTYNDRDSINHARLGVLTLRTLSLPKGLSDQDWRTIRFAVGQHNLKTIRPDLPDHLRHPTNVVRDADKLDIYRVMVEHFTSQNPDPVVTHGFVEKPGEYSLAVYDSIMARETSDYRLIQSANDFKLLVIGWVYDLYYTQSLQLLREKGYLDILFSLLPDDERIQALNKRITNFMDERLS